MRRAVPVRAGRARFLLRIRGAAACCSALAALDAAGRQLPGLAGDARAVLPDQDHLAGAGTGISTTDRRMTHDRDVVLAAVGKADAGLLDREDAALVDNA